MRRQESAHRSKLGRRQTSTRLLVKVALLGLWAYQRWISRFTPVCPQPECCSDYGIRMIRTYGLKIGLEKTISRIEDCGEVC